MTKRAFKLVLFILVCLLIYFSYYFWENNKNLGKIDDFYTKGDYLVITGGGRHFEIKLSSLPIKYNKENFFVKEIPNLNSTLLYYRVISNGFTDFGSLFYFLNKSNELDYSFNNLDSIINVKDKETEFKISDKFSFSIKTKVIIFYLVNIICHVFEFSSYYASYIEYHSYSY